MIRCAAVLCAAIIAVNVLSCGPREPRPSAVQDEAMRAGVKPEQLLQATPDYFRDMDDNVPRPTLSQEAIEGRNMWIVWTGGNDRMWDRLTVDSLGTFDLLKTISSHPPSGDYKVEYPAQPLALPRPCQRTVLQGADRSRPEPFRALARRCATRRASPIRSPTRASIRASGSARAAPPCQSARITANPPELSACACFRTPISTRRRGSGGTPSATTTMPTYYFDPKLVRPYRIGMSCGFCHVGPNPIRPPADPESAEVGEPQLERRRAVFLVGPHLQLDGRRERGELFYQALHVSRPGTLDTSLVSTDSINNPRTMNAVYYLAPRMAEARKWGKEAIGGGERDNKQFNDYLPGNDPLSQFFAWPEHRLDTACAQGRLRLGRRRSAR